MVKKIRPTDPKNFHKVTRNMNIFYLGLILLPFSFSYHHRYIDNWSLGTLILPCNTEFSVWMWTFKIGQFCLKVFSKTVTDRTHLKSPSVRARIEVSDRLGFIFKIRLVYVKLLIFKGNFHFFFTFELQFPPSNVITIVTIHRLVFLVTSLD